MHENYKKVNYKYNNLQLTKKLIFTSPYLQVNERLKYQTENCNNE